MANVILFTSAATGTGYGDAVTGIFDVLSTMKNENDSVTYASVININAVGKDVSIPEDTIGIFVLHPTTLITSKAISDVVVRLIGKCSRSYLSVVWETSVLPKEWSPIFSDTSVFAFDGFLAPSVFMYNHLSSVTKKPIFYYPHYIRKRQPKANLVSDKRFTVLFVGQCTERKGFFDAITAATIAYSSKEDVSAYFKYTVLSHAEMNPSDLINSAIALNKSMDTKFSFYATGAMQSEDDMEELYSSCDLLLFPSRGEGFGLPPCIAMSYGKPVVYVPWSASAETCDHGSNYPVDYDLDIAYGMASYGYTSDMSYARPHMRSIVAMLQQAYADHNVMSDSDRKTRAESLSAFIDERYGYKVIRECLLSIIMNQGNNISKFPYTSIYTKD